MYFGKQIYPFRLTYNKVGALTRLKERLNYYNITDFKSVKDILNFKKSYNRLRNEIIAAHQDIIESEKKALSEDVPKLELELEEMKSLTSKRFM
ncbi:hypothetical protein GCM10023173_16970 [Sphingobacterium thermophilum]|uniref:Uncharacterized protein n=1 Tax=Sphingobacterium thermophilum TaxID=768534 RepID=A0ABP8R307_9SPHI